MFTKTDEQTFIVCTMEQKNKYFKEKSLRTRTSKLAYYTSNFLKLYLGQSNKSPKFDRKLLAINELNSEYIHTRTNYYNKLTSNQNLTNATKLEDFVYTGKLKTYFFDTMKYIRYFNPSFKFKYLFGDITEIFPEPTIVKSRPIIKNNTNSILLNLNKIRHFNFIQDRTGFMQKRNQLVWRGYVKKELRNRISFLEKFIDNPLCNVGQYRGNTISQIWLKDRMSIEDQLQYKFIMSLEGNDVATNLKWIMSSNSIAVMTKPKFETWFMEGTLIPDYHYILVKDDYSDLEEKIYYYILHPKKAIEIQENANTFVAQFQNQKQEDLISLMVLDKYFEMTN